MTERTQTALVVTTIAPPNEALRQLAGMAAAREWRFLVIGDVASPPVFELAGAEFYSVEAQRETGFEYAAACPVKHYARKNIGYLLAARDGADVIVETDDDNLPLAAFGEPRVLRRRARVAGAEGWTNVYGYFTELPVWPRGLPLDEVAKPRPRLEGTMEAECPIQQGLADGNPDVDAVWRLVSPQDVRFRQEEPVLLGRGVWCPFNSQNTTWFRAAFPLLYLPAHCSFRMTDIWRSFVAQRIGWECGWRILFHAATVWQERNFHNLMKDFADEIPGYLNNRRIAETLAALRLKPGPAAAGENLFTCYESLASGGHVPAEELKLVEKWLADLSRMGF